jgi:pimeloyl-ACP methyl ester carboxylesterase
MAGQLTQTAFREIEATTWAGAVTVRVKVAGPQARAVVFLHGPTGLVWDDFLTGLTERNRVLAPEHPGTSPGHEDAIKSVDELWDLVLHYYDLFDALGLEAPHVIGHSFGAMVAAELAATSPDRVASLVLISPLGLWDADEPVAHYQMMTRDELREAMAGPSGPPPLAEPASEDAAHDEQIRWMWSMGCTSKFAWPIPERGLRKRLHRVRAPTLIVAGDQDRIVPASYPQRFAEAIADAELLTLEAAGHAPHLDRPAEALAAIERFLDGAGT